MISLTWFGHTGLQTNRPRPGVLGYYSFGTGADGGGYVLEGRPARRSSERGLKIRASILSDYGRAEGGLAGSSTVLPQWGTAVEGPRLGP
jgi:hypothetical protein